MAAITARKIATPMKRMSGVAALLTLRRDALQALRLVDRVVQEPARLFPDLLGKQIRAAQVPQEALSLTLDVPRFESGKTCASQINRECRTEPRRPGRARIRRSRSRGSRIVACGPVILKTVTCSGVTSPLASKRDGPSTPSGSRSLRSSRSTEPRVPSERAIAASISSAACRLCGRTCRSEPSPRLGRHEGAPEPAGLWATASRAQGSSRTCSAPRGPASLMICGTGKKRP
jgi:hypothetical protein